jgi:uncharacterized membrane protein (UPF0127 family)
LVLTAATLSVPALGQWATPRAEVVFPDQSTVHAEVADTEARRRRGLMFRPSLAPDAGMLFVFDRPGGHPFWMQNCLISIDIIWLDAERRVLSIAASVPPCALADCDPPCGSNACPSYPHEGQALYVLEVVAGFAAAHGVQVGDRIVLRGIDR